MFCGFFSIYSNISDQHAYSQGFYHSLAKNYIVLLTRIMHLIVFYFVILNKKCVLQISKLNSFDLL